MFKKCVASILAIILAAGLAGCGSGMSLLESSGILSKRDDVIEAFAAGKTIAELEAAIDGKTKEEMVDAVSGATLQDTLGYLQGILAAAKAAQ